MRKVSEDIALSIWKRVSQIPGWTAEADAIAILEAVVATSDNPIILEIGGWMGRCTALFSLACRISCGGHVHTVDPFDCSGDEFSIPHYLEGLESSGFENLRGAFDHYVATYGEKDFCIVHVGTVGSVMSGWEEVVDVLLLDGDQSPEGAREAFDCCVPFLRVGGTLILRNTKDRQYAPGHDGHRRLVLEELTKPCFSSVRQVGATTIATKSMELT